MIFFKKQEITSRKCVSIYVVLPPGKLVSRVSRLFVFGHTHTGSSCTQLAFLSDPFRGQSDVKWTKSFYSKSLCWHRLPVMVQGHAK